MLMNSVLKVEKLSKTFDKNVRAVNEVSFEVYENEIFGLIGPNGSGKSTTMKIISTILSSDSGEIQASGKKMQDWGDEFRYEIGYIPQQDALFDHLTVKENLEIFSLAYNMSAKTRHGRINQILRRLDLENYKDRLVGTLSGGYKKRVSIGSAIVHSPKLIIADEITVGLDPVLRYKIHDLLRELKKDASVLLTTHYLEEADALCDRMALFSQGKILKIGKPREVVKSFGLRDLNEVFYKILEAK